MTLILNDMLYFQVTMIPAVTCKIVACVDPWVYAISHPRYRLAHMASWLSSARNSPLLDTDASHKRETFDLPHPATNGQLSIKVVGLACWRAIYHIWELILPQRSFVLRHIYLRQISLKISINHHLQARAAKADAVAPDRRARWLDVDSH